MVSFTQATILLVRSFVLPKYSGPTICFGSNRPESQRRLGADVEAGLIPADRALVSTMVENICYKNAERHFGLEVGRFETKPAAKKAAGKPAAKKPAARAAKRTGR